MTTENSEMSEVIEARASKRANELSGSEWTRYSISIWSDIRKSKDELRLKHPAMFPVALAERLILCFTRSDSRRILDPFLGSGSTLIAARNLGGTGVGFEASREYVQVANARLSQQSLFADSSAFKVIDEDARKLRNFVDSESFDFALTSPPYWNVLNQSRTADYKDIRNYGNYEADLGNISDYSDFLVELKKVWAGVHSALKGGGYFVINVMDLRKKSEFIPFHVDVAKSAIECGFEWDDLIIWDRRADYNNFRTLGYPSVFRINKAHEFLLIFKKPST